MRLIVRNNKWFGFGFAPRHCLAQLLLKLAPFATVTGDSRDLDLSAGWRWEAVQASYGNGFLDTLEHRQQYKLKYSEDLGSGRSQIHAVGAWLLRPVEDSGVGSGGFPHLHDTIDPRQRDQTHTGEIAVNDVWRLGPASELQLSSFFRTYNLSLYSNFGDGLIRQSEFRTVTGGNSTYIRKFNQHIAVLAGIDYFREAPRRDDLDRYDSTNPVSTVRSKTSHPTTSR